MERWTLVRPTEAHLEEVSAYRAAFLAAGDSMDGTGPLRRCENAAEWLRQIRCYEDPATVPEGLVQATQFLCLRESDGRVLGMIQVRHELNDYLAKYAGHIGYSVRPDERRKGVASWMLREVLPYCRSLGLTKVLITCRTDNEGSRRTILSNGGVYESTVYEPDDDEWLERYWISLPACVS